MLITENFGYHDVANKRINKSIKEKNK